jgi:predicted aspartyl protease
MKLRLIEDLPFISVTIEFREQHLELHDVLVDTGSTGCVFSTTPRCLRIIRPVCVPSRRANPVVCADND